MSSIYKELKREVQNARFIAQLKSIKVAASYEATANGLNNNQIEKLFDMIDCRIKEIAENHRRRIGICN